MIKDLKSRELEIKVRDELGVEQQLVNKAEIHDLEPNIKTILSCWCLLSLCKACKKSKKNTSKTI